MTHTIMYTINPHKQFCINVVHDIGVISLGLEIDITTFNPQKIIVSFQVLEIPSLFKGKILSQPKFIAYVDLFSMSGR